MKAISKTAVGVLVIASLLGGALPSPLSAPGHPRPQPTRSPGCHRDRVRALTAPAGRFRRRIRNLPATTALYLALIPAAPIARFAAIPVGHEHDHGKFSCEYDAELP